MNSLQFERRFEAVSAYLDLDGFSSFCADPDNSPKIESFLNFFMQRVRDSLEIKKSAHHIAQVKFLGDGLLIIWEVPKRNAKKFCSRIVLALHNLYRTYPVEILDEVDELILRRHPRKVKIAIVQGELHEFSTEHGSEFVGNSLNMGARLARFMPRMGFLVSRSVALESEVTDLYFRGLARTKGFRSGELNEQEEVRYAKEDAAFLTTEEIDEHLVSIEGEMLFRQIAANQSASKQRVPDSARRSNHRTRTLFIASSLLLENERNELDLSLRTLIQERGGEQRPLDVIRSETESKALDIEGSQAVINRQIEACDYFVCLIDQSIGKYTEMEFDVALKCFAKHQQPKIFVFEKESSVNSTDIDEQHIALVKFKHRLHDMGYYITTYSSVDTIVKHLSKEIMIGVEA